MTNLDKSHGPKGGGYTHIPTVACQLLPGELWACQIDRVAIGRGGALRTREIDGGAQALDFQPDLKVYSDVQISDPAD